MTRTHYLAILSAALLLMPSWLLSAEKSFARNGLLDELYQHTQLEQRLDWIQASMTLNDNRYPLPDAVVDTFNQVVRVRYTPYFFKSAMITTLDEALTIGELQALNSWYRSPLGQKILHLESHANDPANTVRIQRYIDERLSHAPPRSHRAQLINTLVDVLHAVEHGTELAASVSVSAQRLLREVMPILDGQPMRPTRALKEQEKPAIRETLLTQIRNIFFYTYRRLSDQEISRYLDFARSNAMQNFQRGQVQAMTRML